MGYTENDNMVRVDFFKPSGKWYETEGVEWLGYFEPLIYNAFHKSLRAHFEKNGGHKHRLAGMTAICLDPYHEHAHPLMTSDWRDI